jgi:1-acyl-sn-glycerol-3-phosphate acyltransferase
MLYNLLHFLFGLTVKGYFHAIYTKGKEQIPEKGPVIFAPNHPSAFMDPILLSTEIDRKLFFLARGDIFMKPLAAKIFSGLNMIPVYRKGEIQDHGDKNDMVFQKCFDHLSEGKALMIFPEGVSKTERKLRPLKTGIARIALGAEAIHQFSLGVKIIPVGINYSDPHTFRSVVLANFGKAIEVTEFKDLYVLDERKAVETLTEKLKTELEKLLVLLQDENLENLIRQIKQLYQSQIEDTSEFENEGMQAFQLSKEIISAVEYHSMQNPERVKAFQSKINAYMKGLQKLKIRDEQVVGSKLDREAFKSYIFLLAGLPLFLFGLITNYLPYRLAGTIFKLIPAREDFVGSIKIGISMLVFLVSYFIEAGVVGIYTNVWWAMLFFISLYPAGLFVMVFTNRFYNVKSSRWYERLFMRKRDLVNKLKSTRMHLIDELEKGRFEYLKSKK